MAFFQHLPPFSGGLGVLSADFLKSAADGELPMLGVTLAYRDGYFRQRIDAAGRQHETAVPWSFADRLPQLGTRVSIGLAGRSGVIGAWCLVLTGVSGHRLPILFLDCDFAEN